VNSNDKAVVDHSDALQLGSPAIVATAIRKSYSLDDGGSLEILRGVSLTVADGASTVALMGRSGCGKSTLISILGGLEAPTSGQVLIAGQDMTALIGRALNAFRGRNIGVVFQQFHLLEHMTALENVRLPLDLNGVGSEAEEQARAMLNKVGLSHRVDHFPARLSRGECQRVAIARVLVMKPKVLLADEPTGSLDLKTGREVMDLIFELVSEQNIAFVMATHDPLVAERCKTRWHMADGVLT
jgi:putative ABC transport system ATP-binding protein